jgi:hypothetical protein
MGDRHMVGPTQREDFLPLKAHVGFTTKVREFAGSAAS